MVLQPSCRLNRTLESLYIEPLANLVAANDGYVYKVRMTAKSWHNPFPFPPYIPQEALFARMGVGACVYLRGEAMFFKH